MPLPRLVVLGTGFGAFNLVKRLDDGYEVTVISPRNHFLFTPLLPGTTVGTLEFRSIIEPIRYARSAITFYHAAATVLDPAVRLVHCRGAAEGDPFDVSYDILGDRRRCREQYIQGAGRRGTRPVPEGIASCAGAPAADHRVL